MRPLGVDRSSSPACTVAAVAPAAHGARAGYARRTPDRARPARRSKDTSRPCLHRQEGREENRDLAVGQLLSQLCARLAADDGDRGKDCPEEVAKVRSMLDGRLGVPVPLQDDALRLIVIQVDVVLQRDGVLSPHDLYGLSGQALDLLELALVKPEPSDTPSSLTASPPVSVNRNATGWTLAHYETAPASTPSTPARCDHCSAVGGWPAS
jgi:hypothetical protein